MATTTQQTIGEMAATDFRKAEVFRKYGLDFCCRGKNTLEEACDRKGVDTAQVAAELEAIDNHVPQSDQNFTDWEADKLADYIVNTHHKYVTDSHPILHEFTAKVARVHGDKHPELLEVAHYFHEIAEELELHMQKEEHILFPYIKQLYKAKKAGVEIGRPPFGTIQNPIAMMEAEHISAGNITEKLKEITSDFTPPTDACNTYRVLYAKLDEYEKDLHKHIHLENNILFPMAIELEKELFG